MARTERSSYGAYTGVAIALHWAMALLVLGLLAMGWWMAWALESGGEATRRLGYEAVQLHKAAGLAVLALSFARLAWRLAHPAPPLPYGTPRWAALASHVVHVLLYGFMIGMPLTGWAMVSASPEFSSLPTSFFGLFMVPHLPAAEVSAALFGLGAAETAGLARAGHHWLAILGALLAAGHVAAALKHHYWDRDHVLARMTPGVEPRIPVFEPPARRAGALRSGAAAGLSLAVLAAGAALFMTAPPPPPPRAAPAPEPEQVAADAASDSAAPAWKVLAEQSRIAFHGAQLGAPFQGVFEVWRADIRFDPEVLAASRIRVEIDTASAKTGEGQYDGALPQADWFDVAAHPRAVFLAERIEPGAAPGEYRAFGALTIKGVSQEVELPFVLQIEEDTATVSAELALDRLNFGLGASADPAGAFITREIRVEIALTAQRRAGGVD